MIERLLEQTMQKVNYNLSLFSEQVGNKEHIAIDG